MNKQTPAQAKTLLAKILRESFLGVAFKVNIEKSQAIRCSWVDGPAYDQVSPIVDTFMEGRFNGMNDMYEYSDSYGVFDRSIMLGQFRWATTSGNASPAQRAANIAEFNADKMDEDKMTPEHWTHSRSAEHHYGNFVAEKARSLHPTQLSATFQKIEWFPKGKAFEEFLAKKEADEIEREIDMPDPAQKVARL